MRIHIVPLLILFLIVLAGCKKTVAVNESGMDLGKMVDIFVDVQLAEAMNNNKLLDKKILEIPGIDTMYAYIFQKHTVSKDEFNRALSWYLSHPEFAQELIDSSKQKIALISGKPVNDNTKPEK